MRPARSRRVQAQRKFAQGAYVPPNVTTVVAADTRRETTQDARNVTINHMAATSLLDVVSLQSLTSQPVVLIERLRGRHLARDVPAPSPPAETSQPQHLKSTIKKPIDPPKVRTTRSRQDSTRVHAMSLRSRRLSKLELNRLTAQNSVLKRKKPLKRKIYSSDEDEPLIFQKTRNKDSTGATNESVSKEIVSKRKPTKNCEVPRKTIRKVLKTNLVSSKRIKHNIPQKKIPVKSVPQKRIRSECTAKQPAETSVRIIKEKNLTRERGDFVKKAALENLVTRDSIVASDPDDSLAPEDPIARNDLVAPDNQIAREDPVTPDVPVVPDVPVAPDSPVAPDGPIAPVEPVYSDRRYGLGLIDFKDESNSEDFSDQSDPPMTEEELARMDEALAVLNNLPDLDKGSANRSDDESAAQATDPVEEVTNEDLLAQRDSPDAFPRLIYESDDSYDEPLLRDGPAIQDVQHKAAPLSQNDMMDQDEYRLVYSPEPGPSGMQFRKNSEANQNNYDCSNNSQKLTSHFQPSSQKQFSQANGNIETTGKIQSSKTCVAAASRPVQDEIGNEKRADDRDDSHLRNNIPSVLDQLRNYNMITQIKAEIEDERRMIDEVDTMAENLDKEKDAKSMHPRQGTGSDEEPGTSESSAEGGTLKNAPVYYPTTEEFQDPITFYEKIYPEIIKFGVCKVVPPPGWTPPSEVHGDIRFDVMNQYISRLFSRWGPASRELSAIKMCLHHQNINYTRPPQLDGVEINLSKLYHLVQRLGGLETVINKKRWGKVADEMKFRGGNYEKRLDHIYMKYLLPYDTLSHQERQEIMRRVEIAWNKKNQKLLDRAMNPLYRQKRMLGLMEYSDDEDDEEDTIFALNSAEDCILKGHLMQHSRFQKVAAITYENTFGQGSETTGLPSLQQIEDQYWRLVTSGTEHACAHTAAIDTGAEGHGFTTTVEPYASHPWNPKKVIDNPRNVLRYLGPVVGVTLPTLLLGMLFSTSCWHKDPHAVAWYEYQSVGPTRIWYGIPADQADNFRKAVETLSPTSCQNKSLWLSSEITMIPPNVLREHNVSLSRVTQDEREFILAVPNAYSCCISTGYTESESVYFAPPSWLDCTWKVFKEARESCEPTMFSMEHLLYNIGCDKQPVLDILKRALPLYGQMLREEVANRQKLHKRGLPFVQALLKTQEQSSTYRARPQEECDYCRASLFLSKVKGLPAKNSVLCLEHTLTLLDTVRYKDTEVAQLQVLVHVTDKELHRVHDNMKRRLRNS